MSLCVVPSFQVSKVTWRNVGVMCTSHGPSGRLQYPCILYSATVDLVTGRVKGTRPDRRSRHSARNRTRRAILDAAGRLFAERGYAATTIEAIADAADV